MMTADDEVRRDRASELLEEAQSTPGYGINQRIGMAAECGDAHTYYVAHEMVVGDPHEHIIRAASAAVGTGERLVGFMPIYSSAWLARTVHPMAQIAAISAEPGTHER